MRDGEVLNKAIGNGDANFIQEGSVDDLAITGVRILKSVGGSATYSATTKSGVDWPSMTHAEGITNFGEFETLTVTSGNVAGY